MEETMDFIEVSGKTIDEALTNALVKLETTSDKVEYEVIEKGSSGILGIFNTKQAVIKVRKKADADMDSFDEEIKKAEGKVFEKKEKAQEQAQEPAKDQKNVEDIKTGVTMSHEEIESRINTFLKDMFQAMGMDVTIKISYDEEENVNVELDGDNMGVLIGKRGQTLDSIQYLTSLVVNKGKDKYVRIKVDTEDYRKRRKDTLESLAKNIAYKVKRSRRSVSLEPMNPYERRIIHAALQNDKYVSTKSEGEEPFRHVVVFLDREKSANRYEK
jgi:spoIIIJ-associated protein